MVAWVNRTLRAMFGLKTGKSATGWRKLHKDDIRNFYFSPGIILALVRKNTTDGACSTHGRPTL